MPDVYDGGDDNIVTKELRRLADQGDAQAQCELGFRYAHGYGVSRDDQEAAKLYRQAAEQEDADAQHVLGVMYDEGRGVPKDYVLAHMWLNLAAAKGGKDAVKLRDLLEEIMTPVQLAEAQRLAREWKPKGK